MRALLLAVLALAGCEAEPRPLDWRIRFATPDLEARTVLVEARVLRGRCGDAAAEVVYSSLFALGSAGALPPVLGPGSYSLEAYARNAACERIAGDCADERLPPPESGVVELVLQERPPAGVCFGAERCEEGRCSSESMPDGGVEDAAPPDARSPDAGPRDAGPTPDAGPPDAGACATGQTLCPSGCVDLRDDPSHCGACDTSCDPGFDCQLGICRCVAPRSLCGGGICVDTSSDGSNCGACGHVCSGEFSALPRCCAGACTLLTTDEENCGACGTTCIAGIPWCCSGVCSATGC